MQLFAGARRSYPLDGPHFSPHLRGALRLARSVFMAACHDYPRCCAVSQHPPPLPCQSRHGCTHPAFVALRQLPPRSALSAHFPPPVLGPFSMQQLVELKVQCYADHWHQPSPKAVPRAGRRIGWPSLIVSPNTTSVGLKRTRLEP